MKKLGFFFLKINLTKAKQEKEGRQKMDKSKWQSIIIILLLIGQILVNLRISLYREAMNLFLESQVELNQNFFDVIESIRNFQEKELEVLKNYLIRCVS